MSLLILTNLIALCNKTCSKRPHISEAGGRMLSVANSPVTRTWSSKTKSWGERPMQACEWSDQRCNACSNRTRKAEADGRSGALSVVNSLVARPWSYRTKNWGGRKGNSFHSHQLKRISLQKENYSNFLIGFLIH